jgi:hypothetical protein
LATPLAASGAGAAEPQYVEATTGNPGNPRLVIVECADAPDGITAGFVVSPADRNDEHGTVEVRADSSICPAVLVRLLYRNATGRVLLDSETNVEFARGSPAGTLHPFASRPIGTTVGRQRALPHAVGRRLGALDEPGPDTVRRIRALTCWIAAARVRTACAARRL